MSPRAARALAVGYFVACTIAMTWPGLPPLTRVRPLVLGLPFSMAWLAAWVTGGAVVLWILDHSERRARRDRPGTPASPAGPARRR